MISGNILTNYLHFVVFSRSEGSTLHHMAGTNQELLKMNIVPLQSVQCPVSPSNAGQLAQYFSREICLRNASLLMLQPPRLWYVTLFHPIF